MEIEGFIGFWIVKGCGEGNICFTAGGCMDKAASGWGIAWIWGSGQAGDREGGGAKSVQQVT